MNNLMDNPVAQYVVCVDDGAMTQLPGAHRAMGSARRAALSAAKETGAAMLVCVITENGPQPRLRFTPEGVPTPPPGAIVDRRENCTAGDGEGACFCTACRARRRAQR